MVDATWLLVLRFQSLERDINYYQGEARLLRQPGGVPSTSDLPGWLGQKTLPWAPQPHVS